MWFIELTLKAKEQTRPARPRLDREGRIIVAINHIVMISDDGDGCTIQLSIPNVDDMDDDLIAVIESYDMVRNMLCNTRDE